MKIKNFKLVKPNMNEYAKSVGYTICMNIVLSVALGLIAYGIQQHSMLILFGGIALIAINIGTAIGIANFLFEKEETRGVGTAYILQTATLVLLTFISTIFT